MGGVYRLSTLWRLIRTWSDVRLNYCKFHKSEIELYKLDQDINDNGIAVDMELAERAEAPYDEYCEGLKNDIKTKYGISSLKSTIQLKDFVMIQTGKNFDSFRKEDIDTIMAESATMNA